MNVLTIVDTDILIDAARQVGEAVDCLAQIEQQSVLAVSVITQMELLVGCRNKLEMRRTERFLRRFQVLKLNDSICDAALELLRRYRLSHGLVIADALIAATALTVNQPLLSKNRRDYQFIGGLQLLPFPCALT
ncbi:MAG: type II toxin-antitoxin system VapC family toxin [Anaerolineae bacterium]|nr:type II toxin-antitoxin system VapC family toxin [Myxococcota bacterium]MDW8317150.1 type II toxin-antitoxin system VapC family toxin [Anaerolineae bacterium]